MSASQHHTLPGLLESAARKRPQNVALICGRSRLTFDALQRRAQSLAAGLAGLGVEPGDRVAIWLPNGPLWCETLFACAQLGAIAIGVNTRFRSAELADVLGRTGAKVLVFSPRFRRVDFVEILEGADAHALAALTAIVADDDEAQAPRSMCRKRVIAASRLFEHGAHTSRYRGVPGRWYRDRARSESRRVCAHEGWGQGRGCTSTSPRCSRTARRRMARYKVPLRIFPIDEFPMTAGSNAPKVLKTELRQMAEVRLREG